MGQRLTDTNIWVRSKASKALQLFGSGASSQLTTMLTAFITNATDPHVIVWEDPIQIANGYLADELFNTLGSSTINAATNLLYPAVRAGLKQPDGMARGYMGYFIKNRLTWAHVQAVAPALVECIAERSPADRMFSDTIRYDGLATLGKYLVEEGIPLCLMVKEQTWHGDDWLPFDLLTTTYRGAAKEALSTLYKWQEHIPQFQADGSIGGCCPGRFPSITNKIAAAISAISSDPSPPTLNNFKKIVLASATPSTITLPTTNTSLSSVAAPDLDGGVPAFRWSKVSGAGNVSFSPNGTAASSNTVATFNGFGTYVLQASVVDTSILNSNIWITYNLGYYDFKTYTNFIGAACSNVTVIVSVATNRAPVPQNQSLTTPVDTALPITLVAVDPNGDALTYSVVTPPAHGTLTGVAPNLIYTPTNGYTGFDSFTFKANDGQVDSSIATVILDVGTTGNRRPVAINQSVTTAQGAGKAILLTGSDPDLDSLTFMLTSSPGHGTLSGTPPNVTYVPGANFPGGNFNGADSFTFAVSDASLTSAVATVSIIVTPPGPVVNNAVGATNLAAGVAQLRGTLTNAPADVRIYWGATDGGTNPANWTGTILLTNTPQPSFSSNVSNLLYGLTYYYRCSASNLYATGWAPATVSFTTQRPVTPGPELISVNIGSSFQVGLVGPAGGSGLAWNQQPGLETGSALLNSSGAPTTVGFSANASNVGEWGSPPLAMLAGGAFNWTANSSYTLTISGLASSRKYDLSIASYHPNEDGSKALVSTANVTDTASPQTADNGGANGNASTWVQGVNYVRFQNVQPSSGGSITMTIAGQDTTGNRRRAYLSGFQLVDTSPVPLVLSLTNSAATGLAAASAALHATLRCTGTVYQVSAFWNTVNGGTNATLWSNSAYVGSWTNLASTNLTLTATNLAANTPYFFTFRATNAAEVLWATNVLTFTTSPPLGTLMAVDNAAGATNLAVGMAQLRGNLLCTNPATVRIYWGATDGGTNGPWANTNVLANLPNGMFASTVSNLFYGLTYYYRCHASNQTDRAWAPATASFTTLPPSQPSPVPLDGLVLWLGGDLGAQTNGSGGVTNWVDNSGLGNNAVAGAAPTYTSVGLNGKPTLTFNGTSHYLRITNSSIFNFAPNVTIFTVGRAGASGSWAPVFISKNGEGSGWQLRRQGGNNYATFTTRGPSGGDDPAGSIPINNLWQLFTARYDGTTRNLWIDGTNDINLASSGAINANNNLVVIGARDTGSIGGFASCAIAEILVYTNALSASQQAAIGGYLATKYGLSTAYPAFTPPLLLALSNSPASSVASFSAALNSTLACTGSVYNVYAYWNTVNGGTNAPLWTNSAYVGSWTNLTSTNLTFTATNLAPSKLYYFTFRATNAVDMLWATNVLSFTTLTPPVPGVDNTAGATNLSPGIAQLRSTLTNGPADVRLYWGTTDGGTNKGNWANTNLLSNAPSGAFSSNVSNLLYGLTYHYRGYASNQYGTAWAPATANFTTLRPASSLANSAATGITTNVAALNATLGCTGAVYNVVAFWNTINGGTNAALWVNSAYVGSRTNVVSSSLSVSATGLAPNTPYFFTFRATNSLDTLWATNVQSFTTLAPPGPVVDNDGGAMNLSPGLAQLRGTLGNGPADVRLYWGTTDGGTNKGNWANTNLLAGAASGAFWNNASNLLYGLTYYYRGYASNQWGAAWATATTNFTTLRPVSTLANSAATGLATTGAVLNATLASAGALYDVVAYWNTVNGGADPAQWANSAYIGKWTDVVSTNLSVTATGLAPNTPYFFTFLATNALDTLWATNVQSFTTLAPLPPPLVISGMTVAGDGTGSIAGTGATGQTFVLMQSPDLAAPSSLWTPVLTNSEGIGAFNFSIPVGLEPSVYFRVFAY